ncbi:MAG TPA: peptidoglycan-binding protein [Kofleriaceae bacterium]|nr:peptidoglycan-binding protein [Kofleriaceae bacterium]
MSLRFVVAVGVVATSACTGGDERAPEVAVARAEAEASAPPPATISTASGTRTLAATAADARCPRPAQVFFEGTARGWICPDDAPASGLTVIDLDDQWTPRVFAPGPDGAAPTFRASYVALAAEHSPDGDELAPEAQFVELYGVVPNLSVIERRLGDDVRHGCHESIDPAPLQAFTRSVSQANDAAIKAGDQRRAVLALITERERVRRRLPDLDALARVPAWKARVDQLRTLEALRAALTTLQAHLVCDGLFDARKVDGLFTWRTGHGVEMFQRKNFLVPNGRFDEETRLAIIAGSRELAFRGALRVLRERIADATGLIEDGTAGSGPRPVLGRQLEPGIMRAARGYRPLPDAAPDLIGEATEAAATHLGWTDGARTHAWLGQHRDARRVALALPRPPAYHSAAMELSVEIDRGDVWYDRSPVPRVAYRRPALTLFTTVDGVRKPLVRWPSTIGGWADVRMPSGRVVQRWKESDVGPRVWRDLYAAPVWYPPASTPDRDLVRYEWNGKWRLKREVFGPGPGSAYGMVMLVHHVPTPLARKRVRLDDRGIRTHGSASVTSIAHGTSHGCHRLFNHLAVRLGSFLLAHRAHVRRGEEPQPYRRIVNYKGRFAAKLESRGFLYELTPPVPVEVLPGRIRSVRKVPPAGSAPADP